MPRSISVEAERELRRKAAQNIVTWLATGRPDYVVVAGSARRERRGAGKVRGDAACGFRGAANAGCAPPRAYTIGVPWRQ